MDKEGNKQEQQKKTPFHLNVIHWNVNVNFKILKKVNHNGIMACGNNEEDF